MGFDGEVGAGIEASPFHEGDEVAIKSLEKVEGWEALNMRFQQKSSPSSGPPWPEGYRFCIPRRNWRATVIASDGDGGYHELTCLLQVAASSTYRTREFIEADLHDWKLAASYANRFNTHI